MVSARTFLFALATIACTAVSAKPHVKRVQTVTLSSLVGDLICPKGMQLFQVSNQANVPATQSYKVWQYTGDFFNVNWQGLDLVSTAGVDNMPSAVRTFSSLGLTLQEKLNFNLGSVRPTPYQNYFYQQFSLSGEPQVAGTKMSNVQNFFSVSANGANTHMEWQVVGCANATSIAKSIFSRVHGGVLAGAVSHFSS